jgi:NAD(P)-dependent dehydrogenase (short-subunit alcohol dehydrogenase family)
MTCILITGAASGLGHAFLSHYASDPSSTIFAIDRSPIQLPSLCAADVTTSAVDVTSTTSLRALAQSTLKDKAIDLLIHCAGIRGLVQSIHEADPDDIPKADNIDNMDAATMMKTFQVNSLGTFLVIQTFLPNLRNMRVATFDSQSTKPPRVLIMTSRMGSISYNTTGGAFAYRASKAALNAMVKSFSIDVPDVLFILMHPGRVETGIVLSREAGAIEAEVSVRDMLATMQKLGKEDSGRFVDRFGETIGW